ncbi:MAG TPA: SagB/ThcOx family dehydrogenase [Longimicrobiaceae bacterium]|nr:SagB/ThcOx family dehydrogenase [Longimicrobiaceae bacterium]
MPIETVDLVSSQAVTEREEADSLPEIFWENTKLRPRVGIEAAVRRIQWFFADPRKVASARQSFKTYATVPRIALPDPLRPRDPMPPFDQVVLGRRSALLAGSGPVFSARPVPLEHLADLLYFTYGVVRTPAPADARPDAIPAPAPGAPDPSPDDTAPPRSDAQPDLVGEQKARAFARARAQAAEVRRRVAPSGGGLYPLELYALAVNVKGLEPGVYHYNAFGHHLEQLRAADAAAARAEVDRLVTTGLNYEGVALVLVITAVPLRTSFKYGDRGYRLLLAESGHAAQNAYLAATALGVSACAIAGFYDDEVNRALAINGLDEFAAYVMVLGLPLGDGEAATEEGVAGG